MEPTKPHEIFETVTYTGTALPTYAPFKPDMVWIKPRPEETATYTTTHLAYAKDVNKLNHAVQCILQVLTPKQKQKFVSLYMEDKHES